MFMKVLRPGFGPAGIKSLDVFAQKISMEKCRRNAEKWNTRPRNAVEPKFSNGEIKGNSFSEHMSANFKQSLPNLSMNASSPTKMNQPGSKQATTRRSQEATRMQLENSCTPKVQCLYFLWWARTGSPQCLHSTAREHSPPGVVGLPGAICMSRSAKSSMRKKMPRVT